MDNLWRRVLLASVGICAASVFAAETKTSPSTQDAIEAFSDVVGTAAEAVSVEVKRNASVRRDEAIAYFLAKGDDPANITHAGVERSFANYVCAGSAELRRETAALKVLSAYSSAAAGIVAPGGDTFAEQWSRLTLQPQEVFELAGQRSAADDTPSPPGSATFSTCVNEVLRMVPPKGEVATELSNEGALVVITALTSIKSLMDSVAKLATDGLKAVSEVESRKKLKTFVNSQHEQFQSLLGTDLRSEVLDNAWARRKARALLRPYYSFSHMLKDFEPSVRPYSVLEVATEVNIELSEYDAMLVAQPPSVAIRSIAQAENSLHDLVNNDSMPLGTILASLKILSGNLKTLSSDHDDLAKKAGEVARALGKK